MSKKDIKLKAYGKRIDIEFTDGEWIAFYRAGDGKRMRASNLAIPPDLDRDRVVTYIADLLHESATERNPDVIILE
jgi:hypothetical protein